MRLLLVRHGETPWNVTLQYQGHAPIPLNQRGEQQAAAIAGRLSALQPTALYSSDLLRAAQTAEAIHRMCRLPVSWLTDVREIDVGQWEGLTPSQLQQQFPAHMADYERAPAHTVRLGGESYAQLQQRALRALTLIERNHSPADRVIVVSHGGTIRTIICHVIGLDLNAFGRLWLDNGSLSELELTRHGWRLVRFNDTAHLEGNVAAGGE